MYGDQVPTPRYGQPRYRLIAEELRERIESGLIPPGTLLPAESTLTAEFGASRGTIRHAIATLRDEGIVATQSGRGTFVALPQTDRSEAPTQRQIIADEHLAKLLGVAIGALLVEHESVIRKPGKANRVVRLIEPTQGPDS
ncbi:GntR family transcriptional regulator [Micromonospora sp. NPDC049366]|uniref:GntR family transcriptional regulator n=1 Tax=Micromonospora sp. NPDC049366 TaxID=3364271 RepID=UPI0037BCD705